METVILVHGLWMTGIELGLLRRRLTHEHGFDVQVFAYPTLHGDPSSICAELADAVRRAAGTRVHLVGHSLGGAFVFRALQQCAPTLTGNAVLLGSPLNGSRAARGALRWPMLRPLLGSHVVQELAEPCGREWHGGVALGAIAGSRPAGDGAVLRALRRGQRRHGGGRRDDHPGSRRSHRAAAQPHRHAVRGRRRRERRALSADGPVSGIQSYLARRRSAAVAARRRSARVSRGPVTTIEERCRAQKGAPHILSALTASAAVSRNRRRVITSGVVRDVYRWELMRACGPRDTRSKRRLADATVASRAGAWTRWYPSREAGLRPRSWTLRALLAKGCLDDSAIPRLIRRSPTARAGHPLALCNDPQSWCAAGDTPRPRVGEQPPAARRRATTAAGGYRTSFEAAAAASITRLSSSSDQPPPSAR